MRNKLEKFSTGRIPRDKMAEIFQGWNAYAKWANTYKLRKHIYKEMLNLINPVYLP